MAKKKTHSKGGLFGVVAGLVRAGGLRTMLVLMGSLVIVGGAYAAWRSVRAHVMGSPEYWLTAEDITITEPPKWIRVDIKSDVARDAGLNRKLTILDDDFAERVHQAFSLHPWVAKVTRVTKRYPASVEVDLVYREPVAMVELPGGGLLPIDESGIHLPIGDFASVEIPRYPRISNLETTPLTDTPGTEWGDDRVVRAAKIAAVLKPVWPQLNVTQIVPAGADAQNAANLAGTTLYELIGRDGTRILWGSPPGEELIGEVSAEEKTKSLLDYVWRSAEERGGGRGSVFDLRQPQPKVMRAIGS
ncbi:MAG: hypothetical protein MI757_00250 [Pirellulales bacterium]|nr:hypothetical protein [Pirellulales bacterium]